MSNLRGRNILLFGPPGIGKSTIIKKLIISGYPAVDLESIYPDKFRFKAPDVLHNTVIGAADLDPKKYSNNITVLLYLNQKDYDLRRRFRDSWEPGKATQKHHNIDDWKKGVKYTHIFYADDSIVDKIINLLESEQNSR